ncbi:hypothetical protein RJ639_038056 [Escallonia herrerae]|uniref:Uncharacterized protein n=1 Tax=Escallonia herrerae TaxID=1293975 RepID=A0AA89B8F0_9ASTE|nr:hypothetical protein RJ639_038056 [Escallonia herrerae]
MAVDQQSETAAAVKLKGSNPFGNARPSEENLKEKGQDWKEIAAAAAAADDDDDGDADAVGDNDTQEG